MEYRKLGSTGIQISRISMGSHHLKNPQDIDKHAENFFYAYKQGINFFETGDTYGNNCSELILGTAIKEMKKHKKPFYIMSKTHAGDSKTFRKNLENSLKNLGISCIDSFTCLWGVKSFEEWRGAKNYGAIREMEKAREEGLIKHITFSSHLQNKELIEMIGEYKFDYSLQGFNIINSKYRLKGIMKTHEKDIGTIAMNPLATGDLLLYEDIFNAIRIKEDQTLVQAAYAYILSFPFIDSVLGTFNSKDEINEAIKTLYQEPYSAKERSEQEGKLKERINQVDLERKIEVGKALRQRPHILREEVADLFGVYPLSV
ncbi:MULTISPECIES: aldo/keto reductase [Campylobacter]|jgi:hypothetical protein|uniref:aldo/keto reductase n=1 Tax=Campylobacter TaxID=194 RepID=UPI00027A3471|nr:MULTISPECIES: aldo/keto reductase [Campylobacter]EJP76037.1 oxidoreductase, aldo/keto reductase family protein [Campylobacter sp. FOBRC14]MBE9819064.1 aldo/keto reductase [Campylobacter concisus]MBE9829178.1 aldo/keto reductase [Campylobacter concisus]OUT07299.1 oxidoreductase [Campylobacter concisus]